MLVLSPPRSGRRPELCGTCVALLYGSCTLASSEEREEGGEEEEERREREGEGEADRKEKKRER